MREEIFCAARLQFRLLTHYVALWHCCCKTIFMTQFWKKLMWECVGRQYKLSKANALYGLVFKMISLYLSTNTSWCLPGRYRTQLRRDWLQSIYLFQFRHKEGDWVRYSWIVFNVEWMDGLTWDSFISDLRSHSHQTPQCECRVCSRSTTQATFLYANFDSSEPWTVHFWWLIQEVSVDFGRDFFFSFFCLYLRFLPIVIVQYIMYYIVSRFWIMLMISVIYRRLIIDLCFLLVLSTT